MSLTLLRRMNKIERANKQLIQQNMDLTEENMDLTQVVLMFSKALIEDHVEEIEI